MWKIKSENIRVFPSVGRTEEYEESYLTTEENLTAPLRALNAENNDSSWVYSKTLEKPFKFIIKGFSFEINDDLPNTAYATIYLNNKKESGDYQLLISKDGWKVLDNDDEFLGLDITETEPQKLTGDIESFTLQLLQDGKIPLTSRIVTYTDNVLNRNDNSPISEKLLTDNIKVNEKIETNDIESEKGTIKTFKSTTSNISIGNITNVNSTDIHTADLTSTGSINGNIITSKKTESDSGTIKELNSTTGTIENLDTTKLTTKTLTSSESINSEKLTVATGNITNTISDNISTNSLTATGNIKGNYIESPTIKATTLLTSPKAEITDLSSTTSTITTGNITTVESTTITTKDLTATGTSNLTTISSTTINATTLESSSASVTGTITGNTVNATNSTIKTLKATDVTITGNLTPPTNFYGKYTISLDGTTISIKENY